MSRILRALNRRIRWKDPRNVDGIDYYPIEGGTTVTRMGGRTPSRVSEYATANGNIVLLEQVDGRTFVRRFLNRHDQDNLAHHHPKQAEAINLAYDGWSHARKTDSFGFRDERAWDSRMVGQNAWVIGIHFVFEDGRWEQKGVERFICHYGDLKFDVGYDVHTRSVRQRGGVMRYEDIDYDEGYVYEWMVPSDCEMTPEQFSRHHVRAPAKPGQAQGRV